MGPLSLRAAHARHNLSAVQVGSHLDASNHDELGGDEKTLTGPAAEFVELVDVDGDGFISWSEFLLLTTLLTIPPAQLKVAFRMFDTENNGVRRCSQQLLWPCCVAPAHACVLWRTLIQWLLLFCGHIAEQTLDQKEFGAMMTAMRAGNGCACRRRTSKTDAAVAASEARMMAPLFEQKTATSQPGRCARMRSPFNG